MSVKNLTPLTVIIGLNCTESKASDTVNSTRLVFVNDCQEWFPLSISVNLFLPSTSPHSPPPLTHPLFADRKLSHSRTSVSAVRLTVGTRLSLPSLLLLLLLLSFLFSLLLFPIYLSWIISCQVLHWHILSHFSPLCVTAFFISTFVQILYNIVTKLWFCRIRYICCWTLLSPITQRKWLHCWILK